jgi:succinylglutamate desuccinylase
MGVQFMIIRRDAQVPSAVEVAADTSGPSVVVFAGVHGDEVSGVHAIEKVFFDFFVGTRKLRQGSLALVRANEQALAAERRYLKYNLNRLFRETYSPEIDRSSYEFRRAQELKTLLRNCDYFLDLHSAPIAQEPFVVAEQGVAGFFSGLGIARIMTGWSKFSGGTIGGDAENYANAHGAKSATLESGSHFDKRSNDVAYRSVLTFLSLLDMIDGVERDGAERQRAVAPEIVDVYSVVTKESEDFRYFGEVDNFKLIPKGKPFAFQNGHELTVSEDSVLLIPMKPEDTRLREEVCYLGRRVDAA